MYRRILFPTDGGVTTERALEHAVDLADRYDADLHVISVVDASVVTGDTEVATLVDEFELTGERTLEDVAGRARAAGLESVRTKLVRGIPHRAILEYADTQDIDLIVMGTHGRTGLDRYLLGSVAGRVVRLSDVPVLTVRREQPA